MTDHYIQFQAQPTNLAKYIYLDKLRNQNEDLFYELAGQHIAEMMPIIYTPTVGEAIENFSALDKPPRALTIAYPDKNCIDAMLADYDSDAIDLIVVTDGEAILGIGDQGANGIHICIGKISVYALCADINPQRILAVQLDVGTNNEKLLSDPLYLGWRKPRIAGEKYDAFIDAFVAAVQKKFPPIYLHWEDFAKANARRILARYQNQMCTFNDDMQGTGIVTLAAIMAALKASEQKLTEQRVVIFGAGTSATGIADQICDAMVLEGITIEEARAKIWMLGRRGLLTTKLEDLNEFQQVYGKNITTEKTSLTDVVDNVKPTILIGCSTVPNAFTEEIITTMAKHVEQPIILPLSNPNSKAEAIPADIRKWTNNKALIATGSPFPATAQCNNALAYPGLGLGIINSKAKRVTKNMLWAACKALTSYAPILHDKNAALLPDITIVKEVSSKIAAAIVKSNS